MGEFVMLNYPFKIPNNVFFGQFVQPWPLFHNLWNDASFSIISFLLTQFLLKWNLGILYAKLEAEGCRKPSMVNRWRDHEQDDWSCYKNMWEFYTSDRKTAYQCLLFCACKISVSKYTEFYTFGRRCYRKSLNYKIQSVKLKNIPFYNPQDEVMVFPLLIPGIDFSFVSDEWMNGKWDIINKATNCSTKPVHGWLKNRHLLSEGKYLDKTKPRCGLWISAFPVNSSGSLMPLGNAGLCVCACWWAQRCITAGNALCTWRRGARANTMLCEQVGAIGDKPPPKLVFYCACLS